VSWRSPPLRPARVAARPKLWSFPKANACFRSLPDCPPPLPPVSRPGPGPGTPRGRAPASRLWSFVGIHRPTPHSALSPAACFFVDPLLWRVRYPRCWAGLLRLSRVCQLRPINSEAKGVRGSSGYVQAEDGVVGDRRVEEVDERDGVEHGHLELAPAERVALLVLCAIVLLCMVAL
jgi:hypothetical protein